MKYTIIFLLLFISTLSQPLLASEKPVLFTIDMSKLLKSSEFGKKIIFEKNRARQELQNENEKLEAKLLLEEKQLSDLRKTLSSNEFRPKAEEFDRKVTIIRVEQAEKEKFLTNQALKEETNFFKNVYPLLYELLADRGGLVLIDQRNAILWDSSIDITDDAISLINKTFSSDVDINLQ